jgi:tetrahydromethanopterin S-methyltransferase subunit A
MANKIAELAGKICEVLLPIKHNIFHGSEQSNVAVCTLSSVDLLEQISKSDLMKSIALVGRLFSENRGIEKLINYVLEHTNIKNIILCGKDTKGHLPGQALLALYKNGIDGNGRIIGALGKDPVLEYVSKHNVDTFRNSVNIIDLVGVTEIDEISNKISTLAKV